MAPENEIWSVYPLKLRGRAGTCLVNLTAPEAEPDYEQPVRVDLRFEIELSNNDGFASREESDQMASQIESFDSILSSRYRGTWVGQVREPGLLMACFYCAQTPGSETLEDFKNSPAGSRVVIDVVTDPEWCYYFDELMPTPFITEWCRNDGVERSLRKNGDPLAKARPIEHCAFFAQQKHAIAFTDAVRAEGFIAHDAELQPPDADFVPSSWLVEFEANALPSADCLAPITLHLRALAAQHEGEYDGWETRVLKD